MRRARPKPWHLTAGAVPLAVEKQVPLEEFIVEMEGLIKKGS